MQKISKAEGDDYDMEIVNYLYMDSALVLPHRPYDLLFRIEPVCSGHGDGARWKEEELVHALEDYGVGVEREDAVVLGLVEGEELGKGFGQGVYLIMQGLLSGCGLYGSGSQYHRW